MIKKIFTLTIILIGAIGMNAQTISGTVTDLSGTPIANHNVNIMNNDTLNSYSASTTTSSTGTYSFTNLASSSLGYTVRLMDCNQAFQTQIVSSNTGTANFSICTNASSPCTAIFMAFADSNNTNMIHFTDYSTGGPTSWAWTFGDGGISSVQHPTHTYTSNGTYNVTLTISGPNCNNSYSSTVTIGTPCHSDFYYSASTANPNLINFTDASAGSPSPTSWSWTFGDGSTSTSQNPSHTYTANGSYSVTLTISGPSCNSTSTQTVVIGGSSGGCQAAFIHSANGLNISFTDQSTGGPTVWSWTFGDGSSSNLQNPTHTYTVAGTYQVSLLISGQNCQSNTTNSVTVTAGTSGNYNISGTITAGSTNVSQGLVKLFNATNNSIVATSAINANGGYNFTGLNSDSYIVLAIPDSTTTIGQTYAPTYFGNIILWSSATSITLNSNLSNQNISLIALPSNNGSGLISGNIGSGSKAGISGLTVYLTDDNNSSAIIASSHTKISGNYSFPNISNGAYKIWVNKTGFAITPISVTLTSSSNISVHNDFIVKSNNTIIPKFTSISTNAIAGAINIFPNPVKNILNVDLDVTQSGKYSFEVYSISGQLLSTQYASIMSGSNLIKINTNNLPQGTYIIRIENSNNQTIQKLFVK